MKEVVRLRMRPSRDGETFRYMLDYMDHSGKRHQISLGHADKRQAERQRQEKELELRVNVAGPVPLGARSLCRHGRQEGEAFEKSVSAC